MKRIITAVGNEELNNLLQKQEGIIVENSDIQYQEGIIEALDKYHNIDIIVVNETIIGDLNIEELIMSIMIIKNDIEIILITENDKEYEHNKNISKLVLHNNNYVEQVMKYILNKDYIKLENETKKHEELRKLNDKQILKDKIIYEKVVIHKKKKRFESINRIRNKAKQFLRKERRKKEVIMVIGTSGVRKDNFYIFISKISKREESFNY